jgi:predicted NBD/HSP70 family sugar kinase
MNPTPVIGIDLGGTKCAVSIPAGDHGVKEVARFATSTPQETLQRLFDEFRKRDAPGRRMAVYRELAEGFGLTVFAVEHRVRKIRQKG